MNKSIIVIAILCLFIACRKKPEGTPPVLPVEDTSVVLNLSFENMVDGKPLILKTEEYTNSVGDTFTVNNYKYYISNIVLFAKDGSEFREQESYHLINHNQPDSKEIVINNLPEGNYTRMQFMIGVDSLRNVSGAQVGALDPINGMFWDWNTGYIMAMLEGNSLQAQYNIVAYHMGGYSGENSVLRTVTLDFPNVAVVSKGKKPVVYITSNAAEWFRTPNLVDFKKKAIVEMGGPEASAIADNYMDMFKVEKVE